MYTIKRLNELKREDKVVVVINQLPFVVTVAEIDLDEGSFIAHESSCDFYVNPVAVVDEDE